MIQYAIAAALAWGILYYAHNDPAAPAWLGLIVLAAVIVFCLTDEIEGKRD